MLPLFRENSKSMLECTLKGTEVLGMQKKLFYVEARSGISHQYQKKMRTNPA